MREFRPGRGGVRLRLGVGGTLAGVGLLTDVLAASAVQPYWGMVALLGVLFPAVGAAMLVGSYRERGLRFEVFEDGIVEHRGGKQRRVRWEDVVSITSDVRQANRRGDREKASERHVLHSRTGIELVFTTGVDDLTELLGLLRTRTLPFLLPAALQKIDSGDEVAFGEFNVSKAGIRTDYQTAGWNEIEGMDVVDDYQLVIKGKGATWMETRMVNVPNMHVLFAVVEELVARHRAA